MICINQIPILHLAYDSSLQEEVENEEMTQQEHALRNKLISHVVSTRFAELIVGSTMLGVACCFMASAAIPTAVITLISIIALTTLLHVVDALLDYRLSCQLIGNHDLDIDANLNKIIALWGFHHYRIFAFSSLDQMTHGALIHELGHAVVAKLLLKDANPKIEIFPNGSGATQLNATELSKWGKRLGDKHTLLAINAAGAAFSIFEAILLLTLAHMVKDKHPQLRLYLICIAIQRVMIHVLYALEDLFLTSPDFSHDFYGMWKIGGIHPLAAIVTMVGIPILCQYALWKWSATYQG